jgi:hypothetical protein
VFMNYFLQNFIKGGASINLMMASRDVSEMLTDVDNHLVEANYRAIKEDISVETAIKKDFFERMLGQFTVFIAVISLIFLTIWMVAVKIPNIYCIFVILLSQLVLFAPKIAVHYMDQKTTT